MALRRVTVFIRHDHRSDERRQWVHRIMENGETGGEAEQRWRKALQKSGVVAVRQKLQQLIGDDTAGTERSSFRTRLSNPPRQFIDAWYREAQQQAHRAKNYRAYLLAAVALAIVATGIVFLLVQ